MDPDLEDLIFSIGEYQISDFAEEQGLMYHLGYVLKKTICTVSKCQCCIDTLTINEDDRDLKHSLIVEKAHTEGSLIFPSKLAYEVFEIANARFMENRDSFVTVAKGLDKFIDWLRKDLIEIHPDFPLCHLDLILRRFFKVRMYFWARYLDAQLQNAIKDQKNKNYDSRAMGAYQANKN